MEELVKGVVLRRAGESIEKVQTDYFTFQLLASHDGAEVMCQTVQPGKRAGMHPEEGWNALECMYILKGEALWQAGDRSVSLGPGDYLAASPVQEPFIITAVTELTLLYICSQPVFHQASQELMRLRSLAVSVEEKDGYTFDHCARIRDHAAEVGRRLGLSPTQLHNLIHGAFLHDLGKVSVPDEILLKPSKLTPEEWAIMKQHPVAGAEMLRNTSVASAAAVLAQHHERLDGRGYPLGLAGDQICVEAQIVAVVDSYDAMTTDRVYRPALSREVAKEELRRGIGALYRKEIVEIYIAFLDELEL